MDNNNLPSIPPITRTYLFGCIIAYISTQYNWINVSTLLYIPERIFSHSEYWRLVTGFFFFRQASALDFVFYMFFLLRTMKRLENGEYKRRTSDFVWVIFLVCVLMLFISPFVPPPHRYFLGPSLCFAMMYIWGRKNPQVPFQLFFIPITAPYLAFAMALLNLVFGGIPYIHILGICCGHVIYYFEDIYPTLPGRNKRNFVAAPSLIKRFFQEYEGQPQYDAPLIM